MLFKLTIAALLAAMTTAAPLAEACEGKKDHAKQEEKAPPKKIASATFRVEGMTCTGCSDKVKSTLAAKAGILKVTVATDNKKITVDYDPEKWTVASLAKAITDIGYRATAEA